MNRLVRAFYILTCSLATLAGPVYASQLGSEGLEGKQWIHGAADCSENQDPAVEVYRHDAATYILRQNKCLSFEAPFMYLLLGQGRALLLDTGAISEDVDGSLGTIVDELIADRQLLVVHSHSHGDHRAGDALFADRPLTSIVPTDHDGVTNFFALNQWPAGQGSIELVGRRLIVIPTPGHQEESITLYDTRTRWLLTGDTLYPGQIYVKDWQAYRESIANLAAFAEANPVDAILGAHIEIRADGEELYPIGSTFQPQEAALPLDPSVLTDLNNALQTDQREREIVHESLVVTPMNGLQKAISTLGRWLTL